MIGLTLTVCALHCMLTCTQYGCNQEAIRIEQDDTITFIIDPTSL